MSTKEATPGDACPVSSFEELMELVPTNRYRNVIIYVAASMTAMMTAIPVFSYQFLGTTPDHWCHVEELVSSGNWTDDQIKKIASPFTEDSDGHRKYSGCEIYDLNYSDLALREVENVLQELERGEIIRNATIQCSSRDFDNKNIESIVTEWDLVCESRALYSTTQAAIQGGLLLGSLIIGYFIDRFGRNRMHRICVIFFIISSFVTSLSPNIYVYIVLRVFIALLGMGSYMSSFVLCMEIASLKKRAMVGAYMVIPWAFGMMLTSAISFMVRPWRLLQVALSAPIVLLLLDFCVLYESPRWLILRGKHEVALNILKKISEGSKKELPSDQQILQYMEVIQSLNTKPKTSSSSESILVRLKKVLRHVFYMVLNKKLRLQTLGVFFCWFSAAMIYYGVSLASSTLSTDPYLYIVLSGLIEVPSYLVLWPTVLFLGRRKSMILFFMMCSVSIFSVMALVLVDKRDDYSILKLILFLGGKFAVTAAFQLIWIYTAEIYPTQFRSLIVGEASAVARVGSFCSPYINDIMGEANRWSPSALFGVLSILAAIVTITFPEPSGKKLPDSVEALDRIDSAESTVTDTA